jgi:hypothetical protein
MLLTLKGKPHPEERPQGASRRTLGAGASFAFGSLTEFCSGPIKGEGFLAELTNLASLRLGRSTPRQI